MEPKHIKENLSNEKNSHGTIQTNRTKKLTFKQTDDVKNNAK